MPELESELRRARDSLGEPTHDATKRAREAVLATVSPVPPRRSTYRLALAAVAFALVVGVAFVAGFFIAPSGASGAPDGPGFLPADGWNTFQTGLTSPPHAPTATAANVPLGADVFSQSFPWDTIAGLGPGEVLLQATFIPTEESFPSDQFSKRDLPLSLDDAQSGASMEGQPPNVEAYRLVAQVGGFNLDLFVFFGSQPSEQTLQLAQEELDRLVVPATSPTPRPQTTARGSCRAPSLRGRILLEGATGSLMGALHVVNQGSTACTLRGWPTIVLRDANGRVIPSTLAKAPPLWQFSNAERPSGWPTVRLGPNDQAQAFLRLANWCGRPNQRVYFHVDVPGGRVLASARVSVGCNLPTQPVELAVGPFEPPPS